MRAPNPCDAAHAGENAQPACDESPLADPVMKIWGEPYAGQLRYTWSFPTDLWLWGRPFGGGRRPRWRGLGHPACDRRLVRDSAGVAWLRQVGARLHGE
jgi:hypothetical protein